MNTTEASLSVPIPHPCEAPDAIYLRWPALLLWMAVAVGAIEVAYASAATSFLTLIYLFALVQLARAAKWRQAFYFGLTVGILVGMLRLEFFWRIFSGGAVALWLIFAFWIALFVELARLCLHRWGMRRGLLLLPFLWTGLEYFRSELYYLRFSWLGPGYAFAGTPWVIPLSHVGMYGAGFLLMCIACVATLLWQKSKLWSLSALALGIGALNLWGLACRSEPVSTAQTTVHVAGVQMEFPAENEVLLRLNQLIGKHPETELVVLSEYTFTEAIPKSIKEWCRKNHRYLILGGEDPLPGNTYYNTAFVVDPAGEIVFRQVKSVPIQFFKDGRPAPEQRVWDSPWGKIGLCICYDLSYRRVTDGLAAQGAQAIIVPTMDVADWGARQHELHARVAPIRAAEYGIPIFRLASSGISQVVDRCGRVLASAPCPGDGAMVCGTLEMRGPGRRPLDSWLAPASAFLAAILAGWFALLPLAERFWQGRRSEAKLEPRSQL